MNLKHYNKCDCCKYYDLNSIYNYVEFDKPLYSIIQKRKTAKLLFISPDEYLKRISNISKISLETTLKYIDFKNVEKYKEDMLKGDKFPVPFYTKEQNSQEGRHRVLASKKLNCKYIPVIEFKSNITNNDIDIFLNKYKKLNFDELNNIFKNKGFKGISKLGYNNFEQYINFNI